MIKQVIVIRRDLKMRRGKECAQASHAAMKWIVDRITSSMNFEPEVDLRLVDRLQLSKAERDWLTGKFTKICLQIHSETDLLTIHNAAREADLVSSLIQDSGATEFHGVPTYTCIAIGPDESEKIDKITGHLELY